MPPRMLFHRDIFLDCSFPPSGPQICCSFSHCLHIRQVPIWQVSSKSFLTPTPRLHLISVPYSYRTCTVFAICLGLPCGVYVWMNAQVPKQVNKGSIFKNLRMDDSYRPGASAHVGKDLAHQGVLREVFFSNPGPGVTAASDQGFFIHRACHTGVGVFTYSHSSGCAISAFWLCPYCSTSDWGILRLFNWVLSIFSDDICCFSQDFCSIINDSSPLVLEVPWLLNICHFLLLQKHLNRVTHTEYQLIFNLIFFFPSGLETLWVLLS